MPLWPPVDLKKKIHGLVEVNILSDNRNRGKPVLELIFDSGEELYLTANLAEMIGAAAIGAKQRWEDFR